MQIEKLPVSFTGTGDLFASLFLAWMYKSNNNIKESLEKTIATLQAVLKRTYNDIKGISVKCMITIGFKLKELHISGKEITPRNKELKLIQSKLDIEEPQIVYQAKIVQ